MSILPPFDFDLGSIRGELSEDLKEACEEQLMGCEDCFNVSFSHLGLFNGPSYGLFLSPENPMALFHLQEALAEILTNAGAIFKKRKNFYGQLLPICRGINQYRMTETIEQLKSEIQFPLNLPVCELALFINSGDAFYQKTSLFNLFTFPRERVNLFPEMVS